MKGFTVIELLVTLIIVAIITLIGAPSFMGAIKRERLTTEVNELISALATARSEAIKRNQHVIVQSTNDDWGAGWTLYVDMDRDKKISDGDLTLKIWEKLSDRHTLKSDLKESYIDFSPSGGIGTIAHFTLCDENNLNTAKSLKINYIGRARVEEKAVTSCAF